MKKVLGRRDDWHLRRPSLVLRRPSASWIGPLLILVSVVLPWTAFAGATGEDGSVAFGLWVGSVAITLMAWSFALAVRLRFLEPFFGGLDSMYRVHRWAGSLAAVAMFLHTSIEPEIEGGIAGARKAFADAAEDLAGVGEIMIYGLIVLSIFRLFPYRWWRLTHKLFGIPFAFACAHFFTAEKPYANFSGWGIYFAAVMLGGLAAYGWRVVGRDMLLRGAPYEVDQARSDGKTLELVLRPRSRPMTYRAGQFAVIKVEKAGLSEPHVFTIASSPTSGVLRFYIRDLGDWTKRIQTELTAGTKVLVEGPYGRFAPGHDSGGPTLWVAGGVGITPFLSAIDSRSKSDTSPAAVVSEPATLVSEPATLIYCVRTREDAVAIDELDRAHEEGHIRLIVVESSQGRRLDRSMLAEHFGPRGLNGYHVAVCGPASLVATVTAAARSLGAGDIETEHFDIRSGFGPDLSRVTT